MSIASHPVIREVSGTTEWFKIMGITADQFFSVPGLAKTKMEDMLAWLEDHDCKMIHVDMSRADDQSRVAYRQIVFPDQATQLLFKLTWG